MANLKAYLESGIIEKYCLGLATPEEIDALESFSRSCPEFVDKLALNQQLFEQFVSTFQRRAPKGSKQKIIARIKQAQLKKASLNDQERLSTFVPIHSHSDIESWQQLIAPIQPKTDFENIYIHPLYADSQKQLSIVWVKELIPEEIHPELEESFLILEGTAICTIDGVDHFLENGSFMKMPPLGHHKISVTSKTPAKALLSKVRIA